MASGDDEQGYASPIGSPIHGDLKDDEYEDDWDEHESKLDDFQTTFAPPPIIPNEGSRSDDFGEIASAQPHSVDSGAYVNVDVNELELETDRDAVAPAPERKIDSDAAHMHGASNFEVTGSREGAGVGLNKPAQDSFAALCEPAQTAGDQSATLLSLARRLADPFGRLAIASLQQQFVAWHRVRAARL
eukprot:tig00021312_g20061.t1